MGRLIPTKAQWKRWQLPSKHTFIGVLLGGVSVVLAIIALWPSPPHAITTTTQSTTGSQSPIVNTTGSVSVTYQNMDTQQVISRIDTNSARVEAAVKQQVDSSKQEIMLMVQQALFRMGSNAARLETLIKNQGDSNKQEMATLATNIHQDYAKLETVVKINQLSPADQARVTNAVAQANRVGGSSITLGAGTLTIGSGTLSIGP